MRRMKREGGINVVNFGRLLTAMVTPFTAEGEVDYQGASKLALRLVENGSDGLVIAGTTGITLSTEEDQALLNGCGDCGW